MEVRTKMWGITTGRIVRDVVRRTLGNPSDKLFWRQVLTASGNLVFYLQPLSTKRQTSSFFLSYKRDIPDPALEHTC